jgi:hypothetical protein
MTVTPRNVNRKPTNKAGLIKLDDRDLTAVVLRDLSNEGARLRPIGKNIELPERFQLVAPMEKLDAACVVIWRRGYDVGVRFET